MLESNVTKKLRDALVSLEAVVWKISDRFHASRPDLVVFYNGQCSFLEMKVHPGKLTSLQEHTLQELAKKDIPAYQGTYYPKTKLIEICRFNDQLSYSGSIKECASWLLKQNYLSTKRMTFLG